MTSPGAAVLAVDVGGTKIAACRDGGDITRVLTGEDPWAALTALLDPLADGITSVGVGCGGPMEWPAGIVAPLNIPAWREGFPLRDRLSERYGVPVRVHNDAVCMAIGEHAQGGWGVDDLLGVVVSTGVGGGVISRGRLLDGARGNAGHIGHVVVDPEGPLCGCGGRGCAEAIARGPALVAWAAAQGCDATDGVSLAAQAAKGHPVALAAFTRAGRAVGFAIASAAAVLDVRVVVVGGGLALVPQLWPPMQQAVKEHARLGHLRDLSVVPAALGQRSGLAGAAALFDGRYWSPSA
ncbi:MAG TPA: ROK family protein [Mycobacteriales bacterium]|nr:ROK family protein [Mycobacteriales bacterium]